MHELSDAEFRQVVEPLLAPPLPGPPSPPPAYIKVNVNCHDEVTGRTYSIEIDGTDPQRVKEIARDLEASLTNVSVSTTPPQYRTAGGK